FASVRANGLIAMALEEHDYLRWAKHTNGDQDLILVTRKGQSIRFHETDVRVMGRPAAGVNAIRLRGDDELTGMDVIGDPEDTLLVITANGYGKRTPLREYGVQRRFGQGIRTLSKDFHKTGPIIGSGVVKPDDSLTLITSGGVVLRTEIEMIRVYGRSTSGVKMIDLADNDMLVSIAVLSSDSERAKAAAPAGRTNGDGHAASYAEDALDEEMIDDEDLLDDEEMLTDENDSDEVYEDEYYYEDDEDPAPNDGYDAKKQRESAEEQLRAARCSEKRLAAFLLFFAVPGGL